MAGPCYIKSNMADLHEQQIQILQAIHKELLVVAQRDQSCVDVLKDQVKELRMILVGVDGSNGVRSTTKQHDAEIADLKKWRTQFMAIFAMIQLFGVPILIYIIQHLIK